MVKIWDSRERKCDMEYKEITGVDIPVSRLFFGTASKSFLDGTADISILDAAVAQGINAFDTARQYGKSEDVLGEWISKRDNRKDIVLLTKCCHPNILWMPRVHPDIMKHELEQSLEALHTDYIDIFLLHRDDFEVPVDGIVETFNELRADGKIRAFGGSNWSIERIEAANEYAYAHNLIPFTVSSPYFGLVDQIKEPWPGCISIAGDSHIKDREWYEKNNMPVVAYSSLAGGFLSGKVKSNDTASAKKILGKEAYRAYMSDENIKKLGWCEKVAKENGCEVSQVALAWALRQPIDVYPIISASSPERIKQNVEALTLDIKF